MEAVSGDAGRPRSRKALGCFAAALLGASAILQPQVANAAHGGGGGGFHGGGGGFHGGGFGGFHGGGFHGGGFGGFHGGGFHRGGFHAGGVHHGFGRFRGGVDSGIFAPYWLDYCFPHGFRFYLDYRHDYCPPLY